MDLHPIPGAASTPAERAAVDAVLNQRDSGFGIRDSGFGIGDSAGAGFLRAQLLPTLHAVQKRIGWISGGALNYISERLEVPPAEAYGVAAFYHMLALAPQPARVAHVCDDIACRAHGAERVCADLEARLGPPGDPANNGEATWKRSPCLGLCERGPAVLYQVAGGEDFALTGVSADDIVAGLSRTELPPPDRAADVAPQTATPRAPALRLLRRVGIVDPESLDDYRASGGYTALRRALAMGPERVLREVLDSKLVGRGGAAFPTGRKWEAVARNPVRPHYLVCNADESEPGTFKDRVLMEHDPFALVEAMTIAGLATGCERGILYIRGEYPVATARLEHALASARNRGLLGHDVMGEGQRFDIALRRGAGAYICGEETALFNSIEGLRGEPRNKPPFPVQSGVFGKPTLINNVETLVNVLDVILEGGPRFAELGTAGSTGSKLFCVSGSVARPGVYEVPFGVTLRQLVDLAGGVAGNRRLQAVLLGGAAGVFVTPDELDMPLTFEGTRAAGATLGSGVVMLFDDTIDLRDIVRRIAEFFHHESCGQCVPCRVGTIRQEEALHRLAAGTPHGSMASDLRLIDELGQVMRDASICGLGQTASSAVQSAIRKLGLFEVSR